MAVHASVPPPTDWLVQVPLSQLVALQGMEAELVALRDENERLTKRLEGLHRTTYEMMEVIRELRRKG